MSGAVLLGSAQWLHDEETWRYTATLEGVDYVIAPAPKLTGWTLTRELAGEVVITEHGTPSEAMVRAFQEAEG